MRRSKRLPRGQGARLGHGAGMAHIEPGIFQDSPQDPRGVQVILDQQNLEVFDRVGLAFEEQDRPFEQRGFHRVQRHRESRAAAGPRAARLDRALMQDRRRAWRSPGQGRDRRTCS